MDVGALRLLIQYLSFKAKTFCGVHMSQSEHKKTLGKTFFESEKYPFKSRGTSGRKGKRRVDVMQRIRGGTLGLTTLLCLLWALQMCKDPGTKLRRSRQFAVPLPEFREACRKKKQ